MRELREANAWSQQELGERLGRGFRALATIYSNARSRMCSFPIRLRGILPLAWCLVARSARIARSMDLVFIDPSSDLVILQHRSSADSGCSPGVSSRLRCARMALGMNQI